MPRIVVESGPHKGEAHAIPDGEKELRVGRGAAGFIQVSDARASRVHFVLRREDGHYVLEDRSRNGTFVNGIRVEKKKLASGDMLRLGHTFLSYYEDPKDPLLGKTVGGYAIESRLGRGAMGTVYRARQVSLDRAVALKVLSSDLVEDKDFVRRFLEEARSAAKLDHPNVVQVHDAGHHEGLYYLSMEYMAGGSLQAILDKRGLLQPREALPLILGAARALIWAEDLGMVHRDIKPDNLMLDAEGNLKVGDFGIAADTRRSKTLLEGGKVVGTPLFMAPEQAMGKPIDNRADIYALGSTLYTTLSGAYPYDGDTPTEILLKKCKSPPKPLSKMVSGLPRKLLHIVGRMIAPEPDDRYASAREVYKDLSEVYETLKTGDTTVSAPGQAAPEIRRRRGGTTTRAFTIEPGWKKPVLYGSLALAGAAVVALIVWGIVRAGG